MIISLNKLLKQLKLKFKMEIIKWLNANFYFPHCKSAKNISHLKNGIAIA